VLIFNDYDRFSEVVNTLGFFFEHPGCPGPEKMLFLFPAVTVTIAKLIAGYLVSIP
jgi:hypothetical protein